MIVNLDINDLTSLNVLASNFSIKYDESVIDSIYQHIVLFKKNDLLIGYVDFSLFYERAEINYIYVSSEYRGIGIASSLINYIFDNYDLDSITLEVRSSNIAAINLYKKLGFTQCSVRKNYYGNEDALMLIKKLGDNNG